MEGAGVVIAIFCFLGLGIGIWVMSMGLDKTRITDYVSGRGGRVVSINWAPFGKGWFGEKNDRIYEVVYYDNAGNQHFATCKTSFWAGVYWTDDRVTHRKSRWFDALTPMNEPGNSIMKQINADDVQDEPDHEDRRDARQPDERLTERPPKRGATASTDVRSHKPPEHIVDEMRRLREENERLREELQNRGGGA